MFRAIKNISVSCKRFMNHCEIRPAFFGWHWNASDTMGKRFAYGRSFHTSESNNKLFKKETKTKIRQKPQESYENLLISGKTTSRRLDIFPDENTSSKLFGGVMFKDLPIVHIHISENNTIINLTTGNGCTKLKRSCGMEGFRNAKKGTNIAAQTTAVSFARKALDLGYKTVRVKIQGLGPGRSSSIKGLTMTGMEIVSITDATRVSDNPARAKKLRRV